MAKGRGMVRIKSVSLPDVNFAREIRVPDVSVTPAAYPIFAFQAAVANYVDLNCETDPEFNMTRAISVTFPWMAASDTNLSHNVRWNTFLVKVVGDAAHTDIGSLDMLAQTRDEATSQLTAIGKRITNAEILVDTLDHTLTGGDVFALRITRDVGHPDDNLTGDAYLFAGFFSVTEAM